MSTDEQNTNDEENPENLLENSDQAGQELSLDQLSQAYAQVMREQGQLEEKTGDVDLTENLPEDSSKSEAKARNKLTLSQVDELDNAGCAISPQSIVEAMLFVGAPAGTKLTGRKIASVIRDVSPKEVKKIVAELNKEYQQSNGAFEIVSEKGSYQMRLRAELNELQNHFFGRNRPAKLNQNAIDVLAVVAYHQPLSRAKIEKIRLKPSSGVLSQLVRRELLVTSQPDGTKDLLYHTTDRFLELFGLATLDDLPQTSMVSDLEELTDS